MNRKTILLTISVSLLSILLIGGCANDDNEAGCVANQPCPCNGATGVTICLSGQQSCNCGGGAAGAAGQSTSIGGTTGSGGATTGKGGAAAGKGGSGATTGKGGAAAGKGGRTGNTAGKGGGTGGSTAGASGSIETNKEPKIPAVSGDCPEFKSGTISIGGLSDVLLDVGTKAAGPTAPMLFYWHGTGSRATEYQGRATTLAAGIKSEGGVIVSFGSSTAEGNGMCSGTNTFYTGDFPIVDQLAACAVKNYNINPHRIFTGGCSAGGLFAACIAANRSSYFAAAAPNSGGFVGTQPFEDPSHIPALMTMHGGESDVVIVTFSQTSAAADEAFKNAGGFVINCNHGGGHCGAPEELYSAVWEFFKTHPFGVASEPYASDLPSTFPDYCAKY